MKVAVSPRERWTLFALLQQAKAPKAKTIAEQGARSRLRKALGLWPIVTAWRIPRQQGQQVIDPIKLQEDSALFPVTDETCATVIELVEKLIAAEVPGEDDGVLLYELAERLRDVRDGRYTLAEHTADYVEDGDHWLPPHEDGAGA